MNLVLRKLFEPSLQKFLSHQRIHPLCKDLGYLLLDALGLSFFAPFFLPCLGLPCPLKKLIALIDYLNERSLMPLLPRMNFLDR